MDNASPSAPIKMVNGTEEAQNSSTEDRYSDKSRERFQSFTKYNTGLIGYYTVAAQYCALWYVVFAKIGFCMIF